MSFLFQSLLLVGLPLVALPLLIHLINLRRHRRVEWAAMQFLLESQKRNKKWIMLQQLLLLSLRTAAVALVVFMLAGPVLRSEWGRFFGQGTTHHIFLVDDSYSMSDRGESSSAFDEARRVIGSILEEASRQSENQKLTLVRFSTAQRLSAGATPEINEVTLNRELLQRLQSELAEMQPSETDAGPLEAIIAALGLPDSSEDEARIVYLVTDFRRRQWIDHEQLRQVLDQLRAKCEQLNLAQCADKLRANLAVTRLEPESGIRAAGVETWFELTIANHSDQPVTEVAVEVVQDGHKLPAIVVDEVPRRKQATRRFRVTFPTAGAHQMHATLPRDAVAVDNVRYFACQVPATFPVLIIDESPSRDDGFYLRTALDPGGAAPGWSPRVEPASFFRKHEQLRDFAAICLLDIPRLDDPEVEALEQYVKQGGGLAIFLGSQVQRPFYNERLYRDGDGLLPVPLDVPTQLVAETDRIEPDVIVGDHAVFRVFGGQRNSFLPLIGVNFYYAIDPTWRPSARGDTHVLARLRNGAPYVVEREFGSGRVVVQLSKLSPKSTDLGSWSNWSLNPVFPVYANELVGFLSSSRRQFTQFEVGDDVAFDLPERDYQSEVRVRAPHAQAAATETIYPKPVDGVYQVNAGPADASGVWQFELARREGDPERRLAAVNVRPDEGDLHMLGRVFLAQRLAGIDYEYALASQMSGTSDQLAGFQLSDTLLYLLAAVLIGEQLLAVRASYHSRTARNT